MATFDLGAAFQHAVSLHGGGRLAEAERFYREILAQSPLHFDALHLLGVVCHQTGRNGEAVALMQRAIALDTSQPAVHSNLGLALQALHRPAEALASYDLALHLDSTFADALNNRGNALRELGRAREAVESYDRALAVHPGAANALNNRGMAQRDLKRFPEALASFDRAILLKPDYAQAHFNRGFVQLEMGRPEDALASFDRALGIDSRDPALFCNRGNALQALKLHEQALASYDRAIELEPQLAEAFNNRGNALRDLGRPEEALASFDRALAIKPGYAGALNNRGIALRDLNRRADALESYERALALEPGYADALCNRGNVLQDLKRYADALDSYERALRSDPGHAQSHWNESLCRLLVGDFARGWVKYEWRWKTEQANQVRNFPQPLWLGKEQLGGKTVLLHAEQGFGDTLQFCRYAPMVAALGARVVVEVQPPLKELMAGLEGVGDVTARGEALPEFDYHCPLLSLPLAFNTSLATIPSFKAYLRSDPVRLERWRERLGRQSGLRVGLVWSGSGGLRNDPDRSLPLAEIADLAAGGTEIFCLQKEIKPADREFLKRRGNILSFGEELGDFADTAALVNLMDVVISVDTAVAHLAGAMGKAVWILLPYAPTWRWLLDRDDSPWYPSARLFRALTIGDWSSAVAQVRESLRAEILKVRS